MMFKTAFFPLAFAIFFLMPAQAQTGISVSPPRNYFTVAAGSSQTKKVLVSNPSKTTSLDLVISMSDWSYDSKGNNIIAEPASLATSCVNWIAVFPNSFFTLAPGATQELEIMVNPPAEISREPVHTAMLYITQVNAQDAVNESGANIKVSVRTGIKIYHRYEVERSAHIEISNFQYLQALGELQLDFENTGNVWADGGIQWELISQENGAQTALEETVFYTMPADQRQINIALPETLAKGKYIATAVVNYGEDNTLKIAELRFTHE